jgi:peptidoglycan glycosyltransferase
MGRRIRYLGVGLVVLFALILGQLVNVQFLRARTLADDPQNPRLAALHYDNLRGPIYAADGTVLAQSVPNPKGPFKYTRAYPQGSLYAGVLGYDSLFYGTAGLEDQYDQDLRAHRAPPETLGQILNPPGFTTNSLTLTLQPGLQKAAAQALSTLPPGPNRDGAVVVLDPHTGGVLAMVSSPTYDPNQLSSPDVATEQAAHAQAAQPDGEGFSALQPVATARSFPPGSTFKVVTSTAVYHLKPELAGYSFPPSTSLTFSDSNQTLVNDGGQPCGGTMTEMLPQSCDPGYGKLGILLGSPLLNQEAGLFGYDQRPPLDLPGVTTSAFPSVAQVGPASQAFEAYDAIGQYDVRATALQNAMVAAAIADNGTLMVPHLMDRITDHQGNVVRADQPAVLSQVATAAQAQQVNQLMQGVPKAGGTAAGVLDLSLDPAVKTGTAQVQAPGVSENTDDWMIGFAPANNPKVAVAVVVPYQAQSATGAAVAGPIMNAVLTAALRGGG